MRILVVFTGGTIGCEPPDDNQVLNISTDFIHNKTYYIIEHYKRCRIAHPEIEFDTAQPIFTLSENMTIADWNTLLKAFQGVNFSKYDGIIVTHGTDTMALTASLFGMMLAGIEIPVVFVGSNYPLSDERADGHQNFADAVSFIVNAGLCGTFMVFKSIVHLSTRIKMSKHFINEYDTTDGNIFGRIKDGKFMIGGGAGYPSVADLNEKKGKDLILRRIKSLASGVMLIRPYIGLNYDMLQLNDTCEAVLHETYHSFTACTNSGHPENSIIAFAKRCREKNIRLYLAPFSSALLKNENSVKYQSTAQTLEADIGAICEMSLESAYVKLILAHSMYQKKDEIENFLNEPIFFESIFDV